MVEGTKGKRPCAHMQGPSQIAVAAKLDVDALVERQAYKIDGFCDSGHGRRGDGEKRAGAPRVALSGKLGAHAGGTSLR